MSILSYHVPLPPNFVFLFFIFFIFLFLIFINHIHTLIKTTQNFFILYIFFIISIHIKTQTNNWTQNRNSNNHKKLDLFFLLFTFLFSCVHLPSSVPSLFCSLTTSFIPSKHLITQST
jgi:Ca2+/Na+ antiporter